MSATDEPLPDAHGTGYVRRSAAGVRAGPCVAHEVAVRGPVHPVEKGTLRRVV